MHRNRHLLPRPDIIRLDPARLDAAEVDVSVGTDFVGYGLDEALDENLEAW